jgi:hypothetical protein
VLAGLGAARGPAEESTFRRAFAMLDPDKLGQALGTWLHTRAVQVSGRLVITIDGKAVRGAKSRPGRPRTLVASLPPTATTPVTRSARSGCFRPHKRRLCRVPEGSIPGIAVLRELITITARQLVPIISTR